MAGDVVLGRTLLLVVVLLPAARVVGRVVVDAVVVVEVKGVVRVALVAPVEGLVVAVVLAVVVGWPVVVGAAVVELSASPTQRTSRESTTTLPDVPVTTETWPVPGAKSNAPST